MTSIAIQDAFVLCLVESGYENVSMRDIATRAGVGLGTLYLYFPSKESIAAVTMRRWLRSLAREMERRAGDTAHVSRDTLHARVNALVEANLDVIYTHVPQWRALLMLERRITEPSLYRQMYQYFVCMVARIFAAAPDWSAGRDAHAAAFVAFSLLCSATRDALLVLDAMPQRQTWQRQLQTALNGALGVVAV